METSTNSFLVEEKPGKLMLKFAVPCVISLLVGALYNIVDQIFIGWGVGYLGNGATSVVFPMTVLALGIAVMIGDACCAYVSICLGKKDSDSAHKSVGNAVVLAVASGIVLTAAYFLFMDQWLRAFGATENNFDYAKEYFTFIAMGIPFYIFTNAVNPIIRSDGSPGFAMFTTLVGAGINVILDPIAIFVLGWGMRGAALATISGQIVSAVISLSYLFRMKAVRLRRPSFKLSGRLIAKFLPLGISSFLAQISMVFAIAATNNMLVRYGASSIYGSDIPLTVQGIVMKYFQIFISISIGIAAGCIPVVGYNIGARRNDRVRRFLVLMLIAEACLGAIALFVTQVFPLQLIGIFGSESDLYNQFAVLTFRTYLCMIILACINKATFIFMQAMGKPFLSTVLSMFREIVLGVSLVLILPLFFGLDGVLYSMPTADVIAFIASVVVLIYTFRKLGRELPNEETPSADPPLASPQET